MEYNKYMIIVFLNIFSKDLGQVVKSQIRKWKNMRIQIQSLPVNKVL